MVINKLWKTPRSKEK